MTTIGKRIKKIRQELNLSQSEFGKPFNCSKAYISSIERDLVPINADKLTSLLLIYNININYILADIGDMFIESKQVCDNESETVFECKIQQIVLKMKEKGLI